MARSDNAHQRRKQQRRQQRRAAARAAAQGVGTVRGTVVMAWCDLNCPSERGAGPDGSDRHEIKYRPVVLWARSGSGFSAIPLTSDDGARRASLPLTDPVPVGIGVLMAVGGAIRRLVHLPAADVDVHGRTVGRLSERDIRHLEEAVSDGRVADLTAVTGQREAAPAVGGGAARHGPATVPADVAMRRLRDRRAQIIAAHEAAAT